MKKFALFTVKILYQNQQHGKRFARFRAGNFDVKDEPRSGRPITEKSDEIMVKIERDKHVSTVEIARELGIDHKTILNHLHKAGYKKKLDVWVPHELSVRNMMDRINISEENDNW